MIDWQFKIDGTAVQAPTNWQQSEITVERDDLTAGMIRTFTSALDWIGDAYTALRNAYDSAYCNTLECEVLIKKSYGGAFESVFKGTVILAAVTWDRLNCVAKAPIRDRHYTLMIENNRGIKRFVGVTRTKNASTGTGAADQAISMFDPATGVYGITNVEAYIVADVMEELVDFMTDNAVGFTNNVTDLDSLVICNGAAINAAGVGSSRPETSFEELFEEVKKKHNIGLYIDESGPTVVVDSLGNIYGSGTSYTFAGVREIEESIQQERLYQRVDIGAHVHDNAGEWPEIAYFTHKEESYWTAGKCNTDNALDLVSKYHIDSNTIEDVVQTSNDEFDEDNFLIETDLPATAQATKYDLFNTGIAPWNYNEGLTNRNVIPRFDGVLYAPLIQYLGDGNDDFEATKSSSTSEVGPVTTIARVPYDTEVSDPNANYDNAAGQYHYSAPQDGFYRFSCSIEISNVVLDPSGGDLDVELTLERRVAGGGSVIESQAETTTITGTSTITFHPPGFFMESGEEMNVKLIITDTGPGPGTNTYDIDGGTFKTTQVETGGGEFETFEADDARVQLFDFTAPLAAGDFQTILAAQRDKIGFNIARTGVTKTGWIKSMKYNLAQKEAKITVITTRNT